MSCSVRCESKGPSIHAVRHGARHRIFGCPAAHLCGTVRKFHADYAMQEKGIMAPYRHDELPGKYVEMIPLYDEWLAFWREWMEQRAPGNVPETGRQIEEYRRQEARR